MNRWISTALAMGVLAACAPAAVPVPANVDVDMGEIEASVSGKCYATVVIPAIFDVVTAPAGQNRALPDGITAPAQGAGSTTVVGQNIVRERSEVRFETLCPQLYTPEFVSTLQRALTVRGFYKGPITGTLDEATSMAIRRFQRIDGPDSGLLSIATARKLGVVAFDRSTL